MQLKMTTPIDRAQSNLVIDTVNLANSKISCRESLNIAAQDISELMTQDYRGVSSIQEPAHNEEEQEVHAYRFLYSVGIRLIHPEEEKSVEEEGYTPWVEIQATFSASYISSEALEQECLDAFAKDNVGYNVWPFWREFVQSTCCRMGMSHPINIPLYRIKKPA